METITRIDVPTREQVSEESKVFFDGLKKKLGMVPNLYAAIGYSSNALGSFLDFARNAGKGTFSNKEMEAIKLAVSQANDCLYCKSAHTALAKMAGFTEEETTQLRLATIQDEKLKVLTTLAKDVASKAGHVDDDVRERFFEIGYDEAALFDFLAVVVAVTYTNYAFALSQVKVDFPEVH